jgi:hypothetical protein
MFFFSDGFASFQPRDRFKHDCAVFSVDVEDCAFFYAEL